MTTLLDRLVDDAGLFPPTALRRPTPYGATAPTSPPTTPCTPTGSWSPSAAWPRYAPNCGPRTVSPSA
ncbi:hypothetical protein NKH77_55450 [Streptomyces sp. M19]